MKAKNAYVQLIKSHEEKEVMNTITKLFCDWDNTSLFMGDSAVLVFENASRVFCEMLVNDVN